MLLESMDLTYHTCYSPAEKERDRENADGDFNRLSLIDYILTVHHLNPDEETLRQTRLRKIFHPLLG